MDNIINSNTPLLLTNSKIDSTGQQKLHIIIEMPDQKEANCIRWWYLLIFTIICIICIIVYFLKYY